MPQRPDELAAQRLEQLVLGECLLQLVDHPVGAAQPYLKIGPLREHAKPLRDQPFPDPRDPVPRQAGQGLSPPQVRGLSEQVARLLRVVVGHRPGSLRQTTVPIQIEQGGVGVEQIAAPLPDQLDLPPLHLAGTREYPPQTCDIRVQRISHLGRR